MLGRIIFRSMSEISAVVFAVYMGYFLYGAPDYAPAPEIAMQRAFLFCGVCVLYWWLQSGTLAISGVSTSWGMATDILFSLAPILVVGYALVDFWRGTLPLSNFKEYAAYFALAVVLLDLTFNVMIMAHLSRRYLGEVQM